MTSFASFAYFALAEELAERAEAHRASAPTVVVSRTLCHCGTVAELEPDGRRFYCPSCRSVATPWVVDDAWRDRSDLS